MSTHYETTVFARAALHEVELVVADLDVEELATAAREITAAPRVFVTGVGRSGLMAKAVAMRLMHTGLRTYVAGEVATPAIARGDLLVAFSARGSGATLEQLRIAREVGARTLLFGGVRNEHTASVADNIVVIGAGVAVPTEQHAGSLFEQSCLLVGDALARAIRLALGVPESDLDARHANL